MKRVFNILSVMLMTSLMIWSSFHYDDNVKQETVTSTVANYIPTYTSTQNVLDVKIIEEEVEEVEQMSEEDSTTDKDELEKTDSTLEEMSLLFSQGNF